jgi:hypothetical protein
MATKAVVSTTIEVPLDTKGQTRQHLHEALDLILENAKCPGCGLMHTLTGKLTDTPPPR